MSDCAQKIDAPKGERWFRFVGAVQRLVKSAALGTSVLVGADSLEQKLKNNLQT